VLDEMQAVAAAVPKLDGQARRRAAAALSWRRPASPIDAATARAEFSALMADDRPATARVPS